MQPLYCYVKHYTETQDNQTQESYEITFPKDKLLVCPNCRQDPFYLRLTGSLGGHYTTMTHERKYALPNNRLEEMILPIKKTAFKFWDWL